MLILTLHEKAGTSTNEKSVLYAALTPGHPVAGGAGGTAPAVWDSCTHATGSPLAPVGLVGLPAEAGVPRPASSQTTLGV